MGPARPPEKQQQLQPWRLRSTSFIVVDEGTPPSSARSSRNLRQSSVTRWRWPGRALQIQQATWRSRSWEVLYCTPRREEMDTWTRRTRSLLGWRRLLPEQANKLQKVSQLEELLYDGVTKSWSWGSLMPDVSYPIKIPLLQQKK